MKLRKVIMLPMYSQNHEVLTFSKLPVGMSAVALNSGAGRLTLASVTHVVAMLFVVVPQRANLKKKLLALLPD
jgi:hypothetical protein